MKEFIVFLYLTVLMCAFKPVHSMYDLDAEHKKIMEILAEGKWVTDKLSDKLARSHYITIREIKNKTEGKTHSVRIILQPGNKSLQVKANLILIVNAIKADINNHFFNCKWSPAYESGETDIFFGESGKSILEGIPIAVEYKNHKWQENSNLRIVGLRIATGSQTISHIYPLIDE